MRSEMGELAWLMLYLLKPDYTVQRIASTLISDLFLAGSPVLKVKVDVRLLLRR
jgi:hypothetical protein